MIAAVIPAAGSGTRFAVDSTKLPKQYQSLNGMPVYMWAVSAFCRNAQIDRVVLMVSAQMLEETKKDIAGISISGHEKITVITGGATRQESVRKGIEYLSSLPHPEYVLIHDAARPFLTQAMIDEVIKAVTDCGACTLAVALTDTIKRVSNGIIQETLDRSSLYLIQTPQAARFDWLLRAHTAAAEQGFETTDDAAILEFGGHEVSIVYGSRYNLKITNPEDLSISQVIAPIIMNEQQAGGPDF